MNKYLSILCVTAGLAFLPACRTKREKKIDTCQKELKKCNDGIEKENKVLQREKAKLKNCAKDLYADAEVDEQYGNCSSCEK